MRKLSLVLLGLFLGCFFIAQSAVAVPYQVEVGDSIILDTYNPTTMAGEMVFNIVGKEESWGTFCLEYDATTYTQTTYSVDQLIDVTDKWGDIVGNQIAWLYYNWGLDGLNGASSTAVQYAFWLLNGDDKSYSITYNSSQDLTAANTLISNASIAVSNGWENSSRVMLAVVGAGDWYGATNGQDVLVSIQPVPEPATMLLLGTGLIGLAGLSRRKFKS